MTVGGVYTSPVSAKVDGTTGLIALAGFSDSDNTIGVFGLWTGYGAPGNPTSMEFNACDAAARIPFLHSRTRTS